MAAATAGPAYVLDHLGVTGGLLAPADATRFLTRGFTRQWLDTSVRAHLIVTGSLLFGGEAVLAQVSPGQGSALQLGQGDGNQGFVLQVQPWEDTAEIITSVVVTIKAREQSGRLLTVTPLLMTSVTWLDHQVLLRLGTGANPLCVAYQVNLVIASSRGELAQVRLPDIICIPL